MLGHYQDLLSDQIINLTILECKYARQKEGELIDNNNKSNHIGM